MTKKEKTITSKTERITTTYSINVYDSNIIKGSFNVESINKNFIEEVETLLMKNEVEYYKRTDVRTEDKITYE